jgi:hypothetical protein
MQFIIFELKKFTILPSTEEWNVQRNVAAADTHTSPSYCHHHLPRCHAGNAYLQKTDRQLQMGSTALLLAAVIRIEWIE